jgi:hypothetical protein
MAAFLSLLGKVLPIQLVDKNGEDVRFTHIEHVVVHADSSDYRAIIDGRVPPAKDSNSARLPAVIEARADDRGARR